MSGDVIREFLVSLGYQVDEKGERRFVDGVKNVTTEVAKMGLAAAAAAAAVAAAVVKMADQLEDLYFMSQRTGATAENIKALGFAASQMGSSVAGAQGSIESLAKFLRENPGGEGLLGSIGVQTRDANGALRDTTDIMQDIGKRLRDMPQYRGIAYANVFGIDYKTLMALEQGVGKFGDRYKDMLRRFGLNVDDATKKSHALMVSWRDMKAQAGILGTIVGTTLIGAFDELTHRWQSLDDTTKQNIKTGAEWVAGIVGGLALIMAGPVVWIAALAAGILLLWDDYKVWKEGSKSLIDWGKWKPEIDAATVAIEGLAKAIKELIRLKTKLEHMTEHALESVGDAAANRAHQIDQGNGPYDKRQQNSPWHKLLRRVSWALGSNPISGKNDNLPMYDPGGSRSDKPDTSDAGGSTGASGSTRGIRNNNPGNIIYGDFARRHGATGQDSGGFAVFPNATLGLAAINANLQSYGANGVNTPSDIAHRWSTTDQGAYTTRLAGMFGGDANKSLNMNDPAVLNALRNAIILQENGSNPYSKEMVGGAASNAANSSASGIGIDQTVTINLHGVANGADAAKGALEGMSGANDRLVRNMKPAAA